jgi:cytidylate kinase
MAFVVAIDGPAGSGKGTITKLVGSKMNLVNIDTGAMYRCVALDCLRKNIDSTNLEGIEEVLKNIKINFKKENDKELVFLNGENVTEEIRKTLVDNNVAKFAAVKIIRDKVTPMQREMGEKTDVIMEGRDIGTVVFPDADVKIFLDCSVEERARRRYKQDLEKGIQTTYEEVLESIKERHKLETEREVAPFVKAEDAILVDSSNMTIEEVTNRIVEIIKEKRGY